MLQSSGHLRGIGLLGLLGGVSRTPGVGSMKSSASLLCKVQQKSVVVSECTCSVTGIERGRGGVNLRTVESRISLRFREKLPLK